MKNLLKRGPLIFSVVLFILLCVGFYFFYSQININNDRAEQSLIDIENETLHREEVKLLNRSIEKIKGDRDLIGTHFANGSDIVPFLDTIEALAPKAGATASIASVDVLKDNTGLLVRLSASGSFASIYKFIILLENSPYELEITNFSLQKEPSLTTTTDSGEILVSESKWQAVFVVKLLSFLP